MDRLVLQSVCPCINVYLVLHKNDSKLDPIWQSHCCATFWVERPRAKLWAVRVHKQNHWGRISKRSVCRESIGFLKRAQHAFMNRRRGLDNPALIVDTLLLRLNKMSRSKSHLTSVVNQSSNMLHFKTKARWHGVKVASLLTTGCLWFDSVSSYQVDELDCVWVSLCLFVSVLMLFLILHVTLSASNEVQ